MFITSFASGYKWRKQLVSCESYCLGVPASFEGCEFVPPEDRGLILRQLYGRYLELPPVDKRINKHKALWPDFDEFKDWAEAQVKAERATS